MQIIIIAEVLKKKKRKENRIFRAMKEIKKEFFPVYYGENVSQENGNNIKSAKKIIDESMKEIE